MFVVGSYLQRTKQNAEVRSDERALSKAHADAEGDVEVDHGRPIGIGDTRPEPADKVGFGTPNPQPAKGWPERGSCKVDR